MQEPAAQPAHRFARPAGFAAIGVSILVAGIAVALLAGRAEPLSPQQVEQRALATSATSELPSPQAELAPAPEFARADASRQAIAAYAGGDVASAIDRFTAAVEADPDDPEALNNLGQVLVRSGRAREAIPYFDRAIAIAEDVWAYRFNRARAYAELKEWRQAIAGYEESARLFPDDYVTHFNLAKARQANGDLEGAVQAFARAAELAPGQADFQLWYGQALDLTGRTTEAAAAYRRFLELDPDAPQAEKVRARLAQLGSASAASPTS